MKSLKMILLTNKGFNAYKKVEAEPTPAQLKIFLKLIVKQKLVMDKPPYFNMSFKQGRWQEKIVKDMDLLVNLPKAMEKYGAVKDTDFKLEVVE